MAVLTGLEPAGVFQYFEEICAIPHGSGNTKQISDYCVQFAKQHGLSWIQDDSNNVILYKGGTPGYEQSAPVILQGHLDMVCEKEPDCEIDFEKDGLSLQVRDGMIFAEGTTLGGDDGIAVAYALALLDAEDLAHPPLEVVLTTDEETGLCGAAALDVSVLRGRRMLNLDSEEEGILLAGSAGGCRANCHLPLRRREALGLPVTLMIGGLAGGHSGEEIHKGGANANQLLGRLLNELQKTVPYDLILVSGGTKENAIPRQARAELLLDPAKESAFRECVEKYGRIFAAEYQVTDPALFCGCGFSEGGRRSAFVLEDTSKKAVIAALVNLPGGVQCMSADIPGLVQTSLNLGILETQDDRVEMSFSVRSSVSTQKEELVSRLVSLIGLLGGTVTCKGDYPAWEYNRDSRLRELMVTVFEEQYGHKPVVQMIHAGLECGLFAEKLPGLDCVSFGPDMIDIHTARERMSIASVQRTWKYLLEVLKRLK